MPEFRIERGRDPDPKAETPMLVDLAIRNLVSRAFHAGAVAERQGHNSKRMLMVLDELTEKSRMEFYSAVPGRFFLSKVEGKAP